jgi:hypothetical protein
MLTQLEGPAGHNQDGYQHARHGSSNSSPGSRTARCPFSVRSRPPEIDEAQSTAPGQPDIRTLISALAGRSSGSGELYGGAVAGLPSSTCLHHT